MQAGEFVGDVCFYYGDNVPNFVFVKRYDSVVGDGYDYDVVNEEVLLERMGVEDGRIVAVGGMSYRVLVLPAGEAGFAGGGGSCCGWAEAFGGCGA